ncbi:PhoX family phosphatase [Campylobacter lanienae]|uniref:PhoX family phosphatase n=1 Tax=Campylobacter lanienae TaxID=75658 RepID=A0ABY3G609_9BACT|nr:PhoX family phosphatase [Campylobacter lanienae]TWO27672.1 PhoX family phosphatase [Campylobacter lanienae]
MERRNFLKVSSAVLAYAGFFSPSSVLANEKKPLIGFKQIAPSTSDSVIVPKGYEAKKLISWGDPLFSKATPFDESKTINEAAIANANLVFGDNTDGMAWFDLDEDRAILAVNNEYMNPEIMFNHNGKNMSLDDVKYEQNSVGVSIFEIAKNSDGDYSVVLDSPYNRRITANTKMEIQGPARAHNLMKTKADKSGSEVYGTMNNCASGKTPWGTYLTCEENFDDFFGSSDENYAFNPAQKRYGLSVKGENYEWKLDERFDIAKNENEPNRFGWVVEIDPYNPNSTPIKRTALGRFKHENAEVVIAKNGEVVVYMGDDEVNEFIYKFVSKAKYNPNKPNKDILNEGTLYVAKLKDTGDFKGIGEWVALEYGKNGLDSKNGFRNQGDILINARLAASIVGATPMDRPEWIAADPDGKYLYVTLTNNTKRTEVSESNPRAKNIYGHILRWTPKGGNHADSGFKWDIFLLAGNPLKYPNDLRKGTSNINIENMFNSPDGLKFDKFGRLWIQTDGKYSNKGDYEGMGNNQMLCANPITGEVRRFLTGPVACEITGIAFNEDYTTMFVGIQHPGENLANSHYPNGGNSTPRSTIVQIRKKDGGVIGS